MGNRDSYSDSFWFGYPFRTTRKAKEPPLSHL